MWKDKLQTLEQHVQSVISHLSESLQRELGGNRNMVQHELVHTRSTVTKATIHAVWVRCSPPQWCQLTHADAHWREARGHSDRQMEIWEAVNNLPQSEKPSFQTASGTFITMQRLCVLESETWPAWVAECCLTKEADWYLSTSSCAAHSCRAAQEKFVFHSRRVFLCFLMTSVTLLSQNGTKMDGEWRRRLTCSLKTHWKKNWKLASQPRNYLSNMGPV